MSLSSRLDGTLPDLCTPKSRKIGVNLFLFSRSLPLTPHLFWIVLIPVAVDTNLVPPPSPSFPFQIRKLMNTGQIFFTCSCPTHFPFSPLLYFTLFLGGLNSSCPFLCQTYVAPPYQFLIFSPLPPFSSRKSIDVQS